MKELFSIDVKVYDNNEIALSPSEQDFPKVIMVLGEALRLVARKMKEVEVQKILQPQEMKDFLKRRQS